MCEAPKGFFPAGSASLAACGKRACMPQARGSHPQGNRGTAFQRGISLVEIPIALLVVAVVLILAVKTFSTAGSVQRDSHLGNQATAYGVSKLSELEGWPAAQLADGHDRLTSPTGAVFRRVWTVRNKDHGREVTVTVIWRVGNRDETLNLATLLR